MHRASRLALAGLLALTAVPAIAQSNPHARSTPQARDSYGSYRGEAGGASRRGDVGPYSRPAGSGGSIHWNTPNRAGNLGGPSTGGGPSGG